MEGGLLIRNSRGEMNFVGKPPFPFGGCPRSRGGLRAHGKQCRRGGEGTIQRQVKRRGEKQREKKNKREGENSKKTTTGNWKKITGTLPVSKSLFHIV